MEAEVGGPGVRASGAKPSFSQRMQDELEDFRQQSTSLLRESTNEKSQNPKSAIEQSNAGRGRSELGSQLDANGAVVSRASRDGALPLPADKGSRRNSQYESTPAFEINPLPVAQVSQNSSQQKVYRDEDEYFN